MHHRSRGVGGVLSVLVAVGCTLASPVAGQGPSAAAGASQPAEQPYRAPRTPDGQPDLQGFWSNQTYTPLERRDGVTSAFYTEEEVAAIEGRAATRESAQTEPGTIPDVHYDFTQFGLDRSQSALARNLRTSLIVDPPNGKLPPVNAEGRRRAVDVAIERERIGGRWDAAENNQLDDRCIIMAGAGPPMLNSGYNSNYQIVQAPGHVMILTEMIHDARVIPLRPPGVDGADLPPDRVRQWVGMSRGHWEGETLVVETSNFNGKNPLRGSSGQMRVTERFTRVADDTIMYSFMVADEATWESPWTAEMPMQRTRGPLFEFACHEGNYGLYNTLVGARLEERQVAEEAAREAR